MSETFVPSDLNEAIKFCHTAPPLRKLKDFLDRTNLSADVKALIYDLAKFTVKIGEVVVAVGRRIVSIAIWLAQTVPNITLGVLVALVVSTVLGGLPLMPAALALALQKLLLLIGVTAGAIEDIRQNAMKNAMDRVARQFSAFNGQVVA